MATTRELAPTAHPQASDAAEDHAGPVRRFLRWAFTDRTTGNIVIVQVPNIPLIVFLVAAVVSRVATETVANIASIVGTVALVVWAGDEIVRGVNPWRRFLGVAVLAASVVGLLTR